MLTRIKVSWTGDGWKTPLQWCTEASSQSEGSWAALEAGGILLTPQKLLPHFLYFGVIIRREGFVRCPAGPAAPDWQGLSGWPRRCPPPRAVITFPRASFWLWRLLLPSPRAGVELQLKHRVASRHKESYLLKCIRSILLGSSSWIL